VKRLALSMVCTLLSACGGGGSGLTDADINYKDFGVNVAVRSAPYLTQNNHSNAWGQKDCLGCHQNFKHSMATGNLSISQYQKMIDDAVAQVGTTNAIKVCSACHGLNGVSVADYQRRCLICHNSLDRLHFYANTAGRTGSMHDFNGNGAIDDFDCVVCHWQPDMDGIVEPDTDFGKLGGTLKYHTDELCLTCHSNEWSTLSSSALADRDGDGKADAVLSPKEEPVVIIWTNDFHGGRNFASGDRTFKDITFAGTELFGVEHESLVCTQCHNPHASKNDKLIVEKVGETLLIEKPVKQTDNTSVTKYVVVDPQTTEYLSSGRFAGNIAGEDRSYDLSNSTQLSSYISLPVEHSSTGAGTSALRAKTASLCASCHDGTQGYAQANHLGLPVDLDTHHSGSKCTDCHTHGRTF